MNTLPVVYPSFAMGQVGRKLAPTFDDVERARLASLFSSDSVLNAGSPTRITVRAWVFVLSTQNNNGMVTRGNLGGTQGDWAMGIFTGSNTRAGFRVNNNGATATSPNVLSVGVWYFLEGSYDSSLGSDNVKFFENGILVAQANYSTPISNTSAAPVIIGNYFDSAHAFVGHIGEIEFCNNVVRNTANYAVPPTILPDNSTSFLWKAATYSN